MLPHRTLAEAMSAFLLLLFATGSTLTLYVGIGGCDLSDQNCTQPTAAETAISLVRCVGSHCDVRHVAYTPGLPSWLELSHAGECLFAAQTNTNRILSFVADGGKLTLVSDVPSGGMYPVKLDRSADSKLLFVANYADGKGTGASVASFLVNREDCSLSPAHVMAFNRTSVNPTRQQGSHIHTVIVDRDASTSTSIGLMAADLGGDAIYALRADTADGRFSISSVSKASSPGAGPRHIAVHPTLRVAYVVYEMANMLGVYAIRSPDGALTPLQPPLPTLNVSSLPTCIGQPQSFSESCSKAAEVLVTPDGKSVFASNRGFGSPATNTIAGFRVDPSTGKLTAVSTTACPRYPRGVALSSDATELLVAGQDDGSLVSLGIDPDVPGKLSPGVVLVAPWGGSLVTPSALVNAAGYPHHRWR